MLRDASDQRCDAVARVFDASEQAVLHCGVLYLANGRAKLVSSLVLLLTGCSAAPFWQKDRGAKETRCTSSIEVFTDEDAAAARPHRVLRRVSANCTQAEACVSALVTRACELKADAVIVERSSWLRHEMAQPTYRGYRESWQVKEGAPPSATPALGVPNVRVADGRLIVWLDK